MPPLPVCSFLAQISQSLPLTDTWAACVRSWRFTPQLNTTSSSPLSSSWSHIATSYHPALIDFIGTHAIQLVFFWFLSIAYLLIDILFPTFSSSHKLQSSQRQPTRAEIADCFKRVGINQLLSTTAQAVLLLLDYKVLHLPPSYDFSPTLPSIKRVARDIILCILLREIMFYYSHRILHIPQLYPYIHKLHHKFTAPIALSAQYAHPIEHFTANILPLVVPPKLLRMHVTAWWLFLAFELVETTSVHSGYDFWFGWARMHDLHHETFRVNFGTVGLLDYVHGTLGSIVFASRKKQD